MIGLPLIVCTALIALCFVSYLVFLAFVIVRTGTTKGLPDVATAIRAFRPPK
jgi:hypothetical protein